MLTRALELRRLRANRRLGAEALAELRLRKLRAVLRHAGDRVPMYRSLWAEHGVSADAVRSLDELPRLPIVTRQMLREAGDRALAEGGDSRTWVRRRTSGTSGEPLQVTMTAAELQTRALVEFRTLMHMGFRPRDKLVVLGPRSSRPPNLHERLGLYRTGIITIDLPVEEQMERLRRCQPTVLWSYPQPLHAILHRLDYRLSRLVRPRILITSAAALAPNLRERIRQDLGCELFDSYGCMEAGRLAAECSRHDGLHVNADHVIVECAKEPAARGGAGAVIVTTLNAFQMPLVRYRLADLSDGMEGPCACGCAFPRIQAPLGREDDMVVLPSGRLLASWRLWSVVYAIPQVDQFQIVQHAPDRFELRLVLRGEWAPEQEAELRRRLLDGIGEPAHLEIRRLEFMEPASEKLACFLSHVPLPREPS